VDEIIDRIEAGVNVACEERPPNEGERGLVKISAVTWGTYDDNESKTLPVGKDVPETTRIQAGDFLISRANTLELVGACVIVETVTRPVFLSDKVLRLVMPDYQKQWLLMFLQSEDTPPDGSGLRPEGGAAERDRPVGSRLWAACADDRLLALRRSPGYARRLLQHWVTRRSLRVALSFRDTASTLVPDAQGARQARGAVRRPDHGTHQRRYQGTSLCTSALVCPLRNVRSHRAACLVHRKVISPVVSEAPKPRIFGRNRL